MGNRLIPLNKRKILVATNYCMMMIETIQYMHARSLVFHWNLIQYFHWVPLTTSSFTKSTGLQRADSFASKSLSKELQFTGQAQEVTELQFLSPPCIVNFEDGAPSGRCGTPIQYLCSCTFFHTDFLKWSLFLLVF